jgi:hypothetical protein
MAYHCYARILIFRVYAIRDVEFRSSIVVGQWFSKCRNIAYRN